MARQVGYYSNVLRGKRKKESQDEGIRCILELQEPSKKHRKNWSRLIQKIYEADPLSCPKCQGRMRMIAFIEDGELIKKILKHLGLWEVKPRPPPRANAPARNLHIDDTVSQIPPSEDYLSKGPDYPPESCAI